MTAIFIATLIALSVLMPRHGGAPALPISSELDDICSVIFLPVPEWTVAGVTVHGKPPCPIDW
jgi:hypothetical protein